MSINNIPTDSSNERQHRKQIATAVNWILNNGVFNRALFHELTAQFDVTGTTPTDVTSLSVDLIASKLYRFKAVLFFDAAVTGGHKYSLGGTCLADTLICQVSSLDNASGLYVITDRLTALNATAGQAGSISGYTVIDGALDVSQTGTLIPQFAQNAADTLVSSLLPGSFFLVEEMT